jgi:hypothetical protein
VIENAVATEQQHIAVLKFFLALKVKFLHNIIFKLSICTTVVKQ